MKFCPGCGTQLVEGSKFCPACGRNLAPAAPVAPAAKPEKAKKSGKLAVILIIVVALIAALAVVALIGHENGWFDDDDSRSSSRYDDDDDDDHDDDDDDDDRGNSGNGGNNWFGGGATSGNGAGNAATAGTASGNGTVIGTTPGNNASTGPASGDNVRPGTAATTAPTTAVTEATSAPMPMPTEPAMEETVPSENFVDEQVVYDANGIVMVLTGYEQELDGYDNFYFQVENTLKSDIMLYQDAVWINGIGMNCYLDGYVEAESTMTVTLSAERRYLEHANMTSIYEIGMDFTVYDASTYEILFDDRIQTIYTNAPYEGDSAVNTNGSLVMDAYGLYVVYTGTALDEWGYQNLFFYVESTTEDAFLWELAGVVINGVDVTEQFGIYYEVDPWEQWYIYDWCAVEALEYLGISQINEIQFTFNVYDTEWNLVDTVISPTVPG